MGCFALSLNPDFFALRLQEDIHNNSQTKRGIQIRTYHLYSYLQARVQIPVQKIIFLFQ